MYDELTLDEACAIVADFGVFISPDALLLQRRDDRWLISWGSDRIVWLAANDPGKLRLQRERLVLKALRDHVPFQVPIVIAESSDGSCDFRSWVTGQVEPSALHHRVVNDVVFARRFGDELGRMLAAIHAQPLHPLLNNVLPREPEFPTPPDKVLDHLMRVVDDRDLHLRAENVMRSYFEVRDSADSRVCVLVHGDLGFHNIVVAPDSNEIRGVIDWESACRFEYHVDFRYLLADFDHLALFNAAVASYEDESNDRIDLSQVVLYNAAWSLSYLAYRDGVPPDANWCGRTLPEDLAWTRSALRMLDKYHT